MEVKSVNGEEGPSCGGFYIRYRKDFWSEKKKEITIERAPFRILFPRHGHSQFGGKKSMEMPWGILHRKRDLTQGWAAEGAVQKKKKRLQGES